MSAEESRNPYDHQINLLCAWLDAHLERFTPAGSSLTDPAVKPAVEFLIVLRGLRGRLRAGDRPTSLDRWVAGVVGRLWGPAEAWLGGLRWTSLARLARAGRPEVANLMLVPLLEDLDGRASTAHHRVRRVFKGIPWRAVERSNFDLCFACDLAGVRSSRRLAGRQLRQLLDDPSVMKAQPSAYYDLTHTVFLATSMGRRCAWCPAELRPRLDRCMVAGLASRLEASDLDLACEITAAARWSLPNPSPPLRTGTCTALRTAAETVSAHGCVPCHQGRAARLLHGFDRSYHPTLVALLALVCGAEPAGIPRRGTTAVPAALGASRG